MLQAALPTVLHRAFEPARPNPGPGPFLRQWTATRATGTGKRDGLGRGCPQRPGLAGPSRWPLGCSSGRQPGRGLPAYFAHRRRVALLVLSRARTRATHRWAHGSRRPSHLLASLRVEPAAIPWLCAASRAASAAWSAWTGRDHPDDRRGGGGGGGGGAEGVVGRSGTVDTEGARRI